MGEPPASLASHQAEHDQLRALLARYRAALAADFAALRPVPGRYSPLGFHFNFPHNAVLAMVLIALFGDPAPNVALDALLHGGGPAEREEDGAAALARRLTEYAAAARSARPPRPLALRR